jgi:hypothetical protein
MDRPRHPHVVRTWAVERTRHPIHAIPAVKREDPHHGPPRMPVASKLPAAPKKDKPEQP